MTTSHNENGQSIYKESLSFKSIFYFCSLPLRLDSYKGCTFNCLYCFSQNLNNRRYDFFQTKLKIGDPKRLERVFKSSTTKSKNLGVIKSCIQQKIPIHLGSVSDPFQHAEEKYKVTFEYLKILSKFNYPTVISTKGTLISEPEYLHLIRDSPTIVQNSFSTLSDELASRIESGAPSPTERLKSLEKLANSGIWTSIRLQPFLFPFTKPKDISFRSFANAGVKHIVLEHLRIPTNSSKLSRNRFFGKLGMNMIDEFRKLGVRISRINFELASEQKLENIVEIKKLVNNYGMTFGSADNDFHHISDMPCCCGLPNQKEFQNYYKGNIGYSVYDSINSGKVEFGNIEKEWQPSGSISEYLNSDCRKKGIKTVKEFLNLKVENPASSNSPMSFAGIKYNCKKGYQIDEEFREIFLRQEDQENV